VDGLQRSAILLCQFAECQTVLITITVYASSKYGRGVVDVDRVEIVKEEEDGRQW
jgi:hypothetical protein